MGSQYKIRIYIVGVFMAMNIMAHGALAASPKKIKKEASAALAEGNYYLAIDKYAEYCEIKKNDKDAALQLAHLYRITREYDNAIEWYRPFIDLKDYKYKDAVFFYAQIQMTKGNYEEAKKYLTILKKKKRGLSKRSYGKQLKNLIAACDENIKGHPEPENLLVSILRLGDDINKPHMEFSPFPINDSVFMYTSIRAEMDKKGYYKKGEDAVRKLYLAKKRDNVWVYGEPLDKTINLKGINTGNGVMSEDMKTFYFTQSRLNWRKETISEIYVTNKVNNEWTVPQKLPFPINDENYSNTQPCIGKDIRSGAEILYFITERAKGAGGQDIWYVKKNPKTGEYTKMRNAGRKINSPGDEMSPFYDTKSNELYFSSNGRIGIGGMDVFKARGSGSTWKKGIQMLPAPINSGYDDTYFVMENYEGSKVKTGFFSSNRPESNQIVSGTCCEDIYSFKMEKITTSAVKGFVYNMTNTEFYELLKRKFKIDIPVSKENEPLPGVQVYLYEKEKGEQDFLVGTQKTDRNGNFFFDTDPNREYYVKVENYGYFDKKKYFDTKKNYANDTIEVDIGLNFIRPDLTLRLDIYFEYDKDELSKEAKQNLDTTIFEVINMLPNAVFEISSHTDNHGSEAFNDKLSQKRAQTIKDYLIKKGVNPQRLVSLGYGESQPIAPNENPDGSDNPEGRAKNRRSEIKIIDSINTQFDEDN